MGFVKTTVVRVKPCVHITQEEGMFGYETYIDEGDTVDVIDKSGERYEKVRFARMDLGKDVLEPDILVFIDKTGKYIELPTFAIAEVIE